MSKQGPSGLRSVINNGTLVQRNPAPLTDHSLPSRNSPKLNDGNATPNIRPPSTKPHRVNWVQERGWIDAAVAATYATVPDLVNVLSIGSLIFGGCCGNVFALEAIVKDKPGSGPLITYVQLLTTTLLTLPGFISFSAGPRAFFLSPRAIPLSSWLVYTAFFVTVNLLNNWAFAYKISVPLHIILRTGGPVASMIIGYLYNARRYSQVQIFAVLVLTIGVVGAALADAEAQGRSMKIGITLGGDGSSLIMSLTGFTIIALAMILAAFQGVYTDRLYATHGRSNWREALLYSHMLSLPFFLPSFPHLSTQFRALLSSPSLLTFLSDGLQYDGIPGTQFAVLGSNTATSTRTNAVLTRNNPTTAILLATLNQHYFRVISSRIPIHVVFLLANAVTQYLCICGVYHLAATSSSLTVTIVLNVRKLVSLLLSVYIFGNVLANGVLVGAAFVFLGAGLYGMESAMLKKKQPSKTD